jgi:hypothetical protein
MELELPCGPHPRGGGGRKIGTTNRQFAIGPMVMRGEERMGLEGAGATPAASGLNTIGDRGRGQGDGKLHTKWPETRAAGRAAGGGPRAAWDNGIGGTGGRRRGLGVETMDRHLGGEQRGRRGPGGLADFGVLAEH